jgi:hypothetical protein
MPGADAPGYFSSVIHRTEADPMAAQDSRRGINKWRLAAWSGAAALIALPLVAMQFTDEVVWTASDFVFAIVMIGGVGLLLEFAVWLSDSWVYRAGFGFALLGGFMTVWINGAVGIIGDEGNPQNAIFIVVLATAFVGTLFARFRPRPMARALLATAAAQVGCYVYALVAGWDLTLPITVFFLVFWLASAALFHWAADDGARVAGMPSA